MKQISLLLITLFMARTAGIAADVVILNESGVQNLRIETVMVEESEFERSIFALGRIAVYPGRTAAVSTRVAGRALEVNAIHDHPITKGETAVIIESRQPGNPPPEIILPAPISGLVSAVHVVPGQPVSPDNSLAEIIDLTVVYAIAQVPEGLAGQLQKGQAARINVAAVPSGTFEAKLEHLGAMADADSGTVEAAFRVDNPDLLLRPGMRAEFSIVVDQRDNVFSIPREALQGEQANRHVYVKDFDLPNAFIKTPVVVGEINDRMVEIVTGLLPADEVVTRGAYSLGFVGGGSISLKEALDAAHGHEHNEDGSEITQAATSQTGGTPESYATAEPVWKVLCAVLFVLLLISLFRKKPNTAAADPQQ